MADKQKAPCEELIIFIRGIKDEKYRYETGST